MVPIIIEDGRTVRLPRTTWLDKGNFRLFRVERSRATFSFPAGYRSHGRGFQLLWRRHQSRAMTNHGLCGRACTTSNGPSADTTFFKGPRMLAARLTQLRSLRQWVQVFPCVVSIPLPRSSCYPGPRVTRFL